jgi:hypothetical protein
LAAEAAVGSVVVVEVLPFLKLVVEELGVVDDDSVEHAIELFGVDAVRPLDFAVESGGGRFDIDVADAPVQDVVVELGGELGAVIGLDLLHPEGELG